MTFYKMALENKTMLGRSMIVCAVGFYCLLRLGLPSQAHADTSSGDPLQSSWFVDMQRFQKAAHSSFKCEKCHGTMAENGHTHPNPSEPASPDSLKKSAARQFDYSRCQKCHKLAYQRYLKGKHASALKEEAVSASKQTSPVKQKQHTAPTCGNCHSAHYDPAGMSRVAVGQRMVSRCGRCHGEHAASYLDNIHGKFGVNLANKASAFCTDCHGAHKVIAFENQEDALAVCQRCHPNAAAEFSNFVIHASVTGLAAEESPKNKSIVWIHRIKNAAIAVVTFSLIFFFGHTILWLLREKHNKLRKH